MFTKSADSRLGIALFDVLTGRKVLIEKTPFIVGSGDHCDLRLRDDPQAEAEWFEIRRNGTEFRISAGKSAGSIIFDDDQACTTSAIATGGDHTVSGPSQFMVLRNTRNANDWLARMDHRQWFIYDAASEGLIGPFEKGAGLRDAVSARDKDGTTLLLCAGMTTRGFFAGQILDRLAPRAEPPPLTVPPPTAAEAPPLAIDAIDTEHGEFVCPVCWLRFDRGDVMNIASHASLRGDPVLGDFEMQRFHATRFNDRGIALDPMNIPAPEQACPHCRRRLPPGFLDRPHHIFSIIGAPSSGKSYYLSVLTRTLQASLYRHFGVAIRDADPAGNAILNQMISRLFSQASPEDAYIAKTDLEGDLYETLPRYGQKVKLPKPFIFSVSKQDDPAGGFSVVFYDNAGEHFQPGRSSMDSPGAQHIAVASGLFFLFDPLHSPDFLRKLGTVTDPQAAERRDEQQDVLLAETDVRIKSLLGMDSAQRIATPLAVLVGKCDTWQHLLGDLPLEGPLGDGRLDLAALNRNSDRVRSLLIDVCPSVVANAEAISSEVLYFAISPLGTSPVVFTDSAGARRIGPEPGRIAPIGVEIPTLWILSQIAPGMVPIAR
jgi:hypothetical protein